MKTKHNILAALLLSSFFLLPSSFSAQAPNPQVTKVHLIFKTHLDIGFTKLSSEIEHQYLDIFIPNTLKTIDELRARNSPDRYVWTTGSWLIDLYLRNAPPADAARLEAAIRRGDIVWNGVPYTLESESASKELFATCLNLSHELDARFGKHTTAAKMTDVPGHTRAIVSLLADAGFTFLHIGVNGASAVPDTPPVFRWRNTDGKEIIVMYQASYGGDTVLPDGKTAVSINFTHDNAGPHTIAQIKEIYARARAQYPNATIAATSLNEVAADLQFMRDKIPVLTSEIGDTWIYGFGSSPLRIARYRALTRLYAKWLQTGALDKNAPATTAFAVQLGMVSEHTWGLDTKKYLKNYDKYDFDAFTASRTLPEFKKMEQSWAEKDDNIDKAIALLPAKLQTEARAELAPIGQIRIPNIDGAKSFRPDLGAFVLSSINIDTKTSHAVFRDSGAFNASFDGIPLLAGELSYQTYSAADYTAYRAAYNRSDKSWVQQDFGKYGLEKTKAKSASLVPIVTNSKVTEAAGNTLIQYELRFPINKAIDPRVLPEATFLEYNIPATGNSFDVSITFKNKPANRLPESYMFSFIPAGIQKILAEKMGCMVDVSDVVPGGNRQMHAIDNHIDIITDKGTVRITSLDAPLAAIGERRLLNYSRQLPDITGGVHFCLYDNLWGTNFSMWWEGSLTYRFKVEVIPTPPNTSASSAPPLAGVRSPES